MVGSREFHVIEALELDLASAMENVEQLLSEQADDRQRIERLLQTVQEQDLTLQAVADWRPPRDPIGWAKSKLNALSAKARRNWRGIAATALSLFWIFAIGTMVGGVIIPHKNDAPTVEPDYSGCIAQQIFKNPIPDNHYQELVNALWACNVYDDGTDGTD